MKLNKLYFKNLLSFNETKITLSQTNLIVGPNNSGKTNIFRILEWFSKNDLPLNNLRLPKNLRYNSQLESAIGFEIELSKDESQILFQMIFRREISEEIPLNLRTFRILVKWGNTIDDNPVPTYLIIRFENSLTAIGIEELRFFATDTNDWSNLLNKQQDVSGKNFRELDKKVFSLDNENFQKKILSRKFIDLAGDTTFMKNTVKAAFDNNSKIDIDVFEFLDMEKESGKFVTIWLFIGKLLQKNITIIKETRPTSESLAVSIHEWRDTNEEEYQYLKEDFTHLFPKTTFHLEKNKKTSKTTILISENGFNIPLENSASGYFSGLHILYSIYGKKNHSLFFDEPETHFHPSKLTVLANQLSKSSSIGNNQITIITHSPVLLDFSMLQNDNRKVIYVRKDNGDSKIYQPKDKFIPKMKSYHFDASVFFERGCIIVEGPSDEYAIKAISDSYKKLLKHESIALVNAGGKDQVDPFIRLLNEYGIPYVALVDSDYEGFPTGVIKLEYDLEHELEKLGWPRKKNQNGKNEKIRAEKAYSFVTEMLINNQEKEKFEKSPLWQVVQSIIKN